MTYDVSLDGPVRDLTTARLGSRSIRRDHLAGHRDALEAHRRLEERATMAYGSEIRDFRIASPVPRFADFTKG
jgi:hypothetical protein